MIGNFEKEAVVEIQECLDGVGLRRSADELVVIGGAAMAAYGIKNLKNTDLDIVVTGDLMAHLAHDDRWGPSSEHQPKGIVAKNKGTERFVSDPNRYVGLMSVTGDITVITPPLEDSTYNASNYELIKEGIVSEDSHYRFSPLFRILDWKLTLVGNADYPGNKEKHFRDARGIAAYLLRLKTKQA